MTRLSPAPDVSLPRQAPPAVSAAGFWLALGECAAIVALFALHAGWPVPDVNEAHYLCKARHAWDPNYLSNDFFITSPDAHAVFVTTLGWLTRLLDLPQAAWAGRWITWALLAVCWRRLSWAVLPRPGWSILTAALFVAAQERGQMAGEWVVGGFEAKGISYALVLVALEGIVAGRWNRAIFFLGAASGMHVLVGGWATVAAAVAWWFEPRRPGLRSLAGSLAIGALLAAPGVWSGLRLNYGVPAEVVRQAASLYVLERFDHHLVVTTFKTEFLVAFALLTVLWCLLVELVPGTPALWRLRVFILASLGLVAVGSLMSLLVEVAPDTAALALRYYWFRLADAAVPLGAALWGGLFLQRRLAAAPRSAVAWLAVAVGLCGLHFWPHVEGTLLSQRPRADKPGKVADYDAWRAVCQWVHDHTPGDAVFLTPRGAQTFKWYAARAEVVTWKDVPQNAAGILEWWDRLHAVYGTGQQPPHPVWHESLAMRDPPTLREIGRRYGARYLLVESDPPLDLPKLYPRSAEENAHYAVYDLATGDHPPP